MKAKILLFIFFTTSFLTAQNKLTTIKATSKKACIIEGLDERYDWNLSPETRPDIHLMSKTVKPKWIKFYTDIDSIKIELKPGTYFDFIVLLNNTDSCFTRIESPDLKNYSNQKPVTHDTIQFVLTEFNNIKIKTVLNSIDTLNLKFDSGATGLLLTKEAIKNKTHLSWI